MKNHISIVQLDEIEFYTDINDTFNDECFCMLVDDYRKSSTIISCNEAIINMLKYLDCGKMMELLKQYDSSSTATAFAGVSISSDKEWEVYNIDDQAMGKATELADALWDAIKYVINGGNI